MSCAREWQLRFVDAKALDDRAETLLPTNTTGVKNRCEVAVDSMDESSPGIGS